MTNKDGQNMDTTKAFTEEQSELNNKGTGFSSGRGGARPGAGRKKGKPIKPRAEIKKTRSIRMTDDEYPKVLNYLKDIRTAAKAGAEEIK